MDFVGDEDAVRYALEVAVAEHASRLEGSGVHVHHSLPDAGVARAFIDALQERGWRVERLPLVVLHAKVPNAWNSGPDIRKCTKCGVMLWLPADGEWTDTMSIWESPPPGYVNCREARKS